MAPSTNFWGADDFWSGGGGSGGGGGAAGQWIAIPLGLVTVSSTALIPVGSYILQARLIIDTAYSVGTTWSLGIAGTVALFMATTENSPQLVNTYLKFQYVSIGASPAALLATVAGGPAVGAGTALIEYATPDT